MKLSYINLYTTDPSFNLAAEQYVFDCLPKDRTWFMLWQNDRAVIIGKYQNTAAEINESYVRENGIRVVRRLSGGGAVYHDMGNLNYTFITDAPEAERINMKLFCEPVVETLKEFGVEAVINGRNDITVNGKKFSGNSQYIKNGRVMHHGTVMLSSDLDVVERVLNTDAEKVSSKGIKSVRSRVTNILEHAIPGTDLESFRAALINNVCSNAEASEYVLAAEDISRIEAIRQERYLSWDWNYGRSPACSMMKSRRIEGCGRIEAYITSLHGVVEEISFRGDFFSVSEPDGLSELLKGIKLEDAALREALSDVDLNVYFAGIDEESFISLLLG